MTDNRGHVSWAPSDDDGIAAVARSFSGLHMDRGIDGITRRAHALSVRRRAVPAAAAVAFVAAAGAVAVAGPGHSPAPAAAVASSGGATTIGNLELTGFTVRKDTSTGVVTVTVKNFDDPAGLIAALAKDGIKVQVYHQNHIPAKVVQRFGKAMGYSGDTYYTGVPWTKLPDGNYQVQINPKALGPGRVQPLIIVQGYK